MKSKKTTLSSKSARKTRKHKYISLRRELLQPNSPDSGEITQNQHQLNVFPLHPENYFEEKEYNNGDNVSYLFEVEDSASLNGLLSGGSVVYSKEESLSLSLTYAYGGQDCEEGVSWLERTALRHKERDASEEKWVCYTEVVEKKEKEKVKVKEEEMISCSAEYCNNQHRIQKGLSLKLDYQEIMNVWSDRAPLYIDGESPCEIVPDIFDDALAKIAPLS